MFVNSDFSDLLRIFNDKSVRYMVIGGYAVTQHAEPRYTKDLDIWISTDPLNAKAIFEALVAFGAPLTDMTEDAWPRRIQADFDDLSVIFISRQDLITAKVASGRPQDMMDVAALSRLTDD